jgi:hypothetical protein
MMSTSRVGNAWTVGAELGAKDVAIDGSELAAYRLARMSSRLVQHLPGAGVDPMSVWHTLAAWCPVDFVIGRTVAALGQTPPLRGLAIDVLAIRSVQAFVAIDSSCTLTATARVQRAASRGPGVDEVSFDVVVTRNPGGSMVTRFGLDVRLRGPE